MNTENPADKDNVAKRVLWLRHYLGLSQKEFAQSIGVAPSNLNNWEKGKQRLSLEGALRINGVYGTTLDFLFLDRREGLSSEMAKDLLSNPIETETSQSSDSPDS